MSEPHLISLMLENFMMGEPISNHHGVQACPAMENNSNDKYIVKIISIPANPSQVDALVLTGAYPDESAAVAYFKELADGIIGEIDILNKLSEQEGFLPFENFQIESMASGKGFDIYMLSSYKRTLQKHFTRHQLTHLDALNLGLDLCAALGVCRRSGYLYVDLKPSNVYVTEQSQYRIGDLGFMPIDSLKYASLPEKYRSVYTAPEVSDAYSALNTTMDIYAAGLILYQAYNNGALPFTDEILPGDRLPAPVYADYEMSEIILKACDPNPNNRWQDPLQMGQAIVSYMQRNGAMDTPIIPVENIIDSQEDSIPTETPVQTDADSNADAPKPGSFTEDEFGNLSFLEDVSAEDAALSEDYESLTGEVSEILNQADELATVSVPEPVIVPEHIDLPEPDPILPEIDEEASEEAPSQSDFEESNVEESVTEEVAVEQEETTPKKKFHWIRNSIILAVILALIGCGIYFYRQHYLLPIDAIWLDGSESYLTVYIDTSIDESLLEIVCIDTYGNQIPAPVIDGKAEFSDLLPNTAYSIKVVANGFHRLVGSITTAYSTPIQTNIVQFDAITGISDGSVILSFTVEGPDCNEWNVQYFTDGEPVRTASFNSHMVSLTDLTVGKEYTFRLVPAEELFLSGQEEIQFTACKLIRAENLEIVSCMNNTLVAKWNAPEGSEVANWTVSCTGTDYNQTVTTTDTTVTFQGLDHTAAYSIEVKANYMSIGEKATVPANSVTVTNLNTDTTNPAALAFTWDTNSEIPADGWVFHYSIIGIDIEETILCDQNTAVITPVIPNATYRVWLTDAAGNVLLSSRSLITSPAPVNFAAEFDKFTVAQENLTFQMCKTPEKINWNRFDPDDLDYTTAFTTEEGASFLITLNKKNTKSTQGISIMYVLRTQNGSPLNITIVNTTWKDMWHDKYCQLSVPIMPATAGEYMMEIYFNGGLAATQVFTIA